MRNWIDLIENTEIPAITPAALSAAIRRVTKSWLDIGKISTIREIGNGLCYDFCEEVYRQLGLEEEYSRETGSYGIDKMRTEDFWSDDFHASTKLLKQAGEPIPKDIPKQAFEELIGSATHEWIKHKNGLHYDATCPEGVAHMLDMPFFADQISGLRSEMHLPDFIVTMMAAYQNHPPREHRVLVRAEDEKTAATKAEEELDPAFTFHGIVRVEKR